MLFTFLKAMTCKFFRIWLLLNETMSSSIFIFQEIPTRIKELMNKLCFAVTVKRSYGQFKISKRERTNPNSISKCKKANNQKQNTNLNKICMLKMNYCRILHRSWAKYFIKGKIWKVTTTIFKVPFNITVSVLST